MEELPFSWFENYEYETNHKTFKNKPNELFNDESKLYHCHCGREYKTKGSLNDHRRWECGKQPSFQCPYCIYCAKRKKHLRRHVITVHKIQFSLEEADRARIELVD